MKKCNLTLHCGAQEVAREQIFQVPVPRATRTWSPLPHHRLLNLVECSLFRQHLRVVSQAHSLSPDGMRYFGLLQILPGGGREDYSWVLGVRNSHDKRFPAGLVGGAQVFVCDNLSFSGEIKIARKHTRYIERDLPQLVAQAISTLKENYHILDNRIAAYRQHGITDRTVHDLMIRAVDQEVCPITKVPGILKEWREPRYEDFRPRNVWSLMNAFTETLKGDLNHLTTRTTRLHQLLDSHIGTLNPTTN